MPLFAQAAAGIEKLRFQHYAASGIIPATSAAYEQAKQFDQAEAWRRKWLAAVKIQSGAASPAYAGALASLGGNLLQQKRTSCDERDFRATKPRHRLEVRALAR